MPLHRLPPFALAALLVACGGSTTPSATTADRSIEDEEDEDFYADEEELEEVADAEASGRGFVDEALLRGVVLTLGEAAEVPGTGVTMRPPSGAQPMPFGAGFLALRERVQVSVAVVMGDEAVLETIRTGGDENAPAPAEETEVTISGQTGRLGRDVVRTQAGVLERQWLLVHDGTRGLGIVATYEQERAQSYRPVIHQSLLDVVWDREAPLDAAAALGIDIGPVEGLELSSRSTANVVLIEPGADFPPEPGQVVLTVSPLPARIPEERAMGLCPQLAARFLPAPEDDVIHEGELTDGPLRGCERVATAELDSGERVITYIALLFHEGTPVLVTGSFAEDRQAIWRPRFTAAAQTVRIR